MTARDAIAEFRQTYPECPETPEALDLLQAVATEALGWVCTRRSEVAVACVAEDPYADLAGDVVKVHTAEYSFDGESTPLAATTEDFLDSNIAQWRDADPGTPAYFAATVGPTGGRIALYPPPADAGSLSIQASVVSTYAMDDDLPDVPLAVDVLADGMRARFAKRTLRFDEADRFARYFEEGLSRQASLLMERAGTLPKFVGFGQRKNYAR